jgi:hypothetical protein
LQISFLFCIFEVRENYYVKTEFTAETSAKIVASANSDDKTSRVADITVGAENKKRA